MLYFLIDDHSKIPGEAHELELYQRVTRFVKRQSARAARHGDDKRAHAVGFLMSLYQRSLAPSVRSLRRSLQNRAERLTRSLERADYLARQAPPGLDWDDLDEADDTERERLAEILEAITLTSNAAEIRTEIEELSVSELADQARCVEDSGEEAKLSRLREVLEDQAFFTNPPSSY